MKKLFYGAALLAVAAGSFAFLPKAEEPAGYMMVIGSCSGNGLTLLSGQIGTIDPRGQILLTPLDLKGRAAEKMVALHQAEAQKINELHQQGWYLTQVSTHDVGAVHFETIYTLERK